VNADKTKYMVMSRDRNARRSDIIKIDNSSCERVEEFRYLGTTITSHNSIQEEIKSRLMSGNACYYSVQTLLLGWISRRWDVGIWTVLGWPRIETGGGRL